MSILGEEPRDRREALRLARLALNLARVDADPYL